MEWINRDKLTPFDLQVMNLIALMPHKVMLRSGALAIPAIAAFQKSTLGMQTVKPESPTPNYRKLSWRGQILVGREYHRLLQQIVPELPKAETDAAQQAGSKMNPNPGLTATGLQAIQQRRMQDMQNMLASNLSDLQARMGIDLSREMQAAERRRMAEMQMQLLNVMPQAVISPSIVQNVAGSLLDERFAKDKLQKDKPPE